MRFYALVATSKVSPDVPELMDSWDADAVAEDAGLTLDMKQALGNELRDDENADVGFVTIEVPDDAILSHIRWDKLEKIPGAVRRDPSTE
ncbi:hypothetical protein EV193_104350 [Herbihabitans rhizosphaerae]|uniref:Uncharacterized protein n=1 Tax=Herbihabitans rhizosphaerae TaxID=1872711 RepID=A0A4Q7KRJ5_9PSEU|nr:hypothetical protein [Herbihabitans rhizosphaerae]RZS39134.1 hypothetical protein EV193_104350 [Herbihabitans rhizosphaerae]